MSNSVPHCSAMITSAPPGLEDLVSPSFGPGRWLSSTGYAAEEPVKLARTAGGLLVTILMDGTPAPPAEWKAQSEAALGTDCQSTGTPGSALDEEEEDDDAPKKKKKTRFCKAKRDHYRRLVEQLVQIAQTCPENFSLDVVRLPKSIATCQESRSKLLATVMRFAMADSRA